MTTHVAQAVIFFLIFFLGVIGNSVVLFVLLRQRASWSITTTYLFNLAIADTLFVCFLPFWGHYHLSGMTWSFGTAMCKAAGTMTYVNMYASIFFLSAMSIDRWTAIVHATRMNLRRNTNFSRYICCLIWCCSLVLCLPSMIFRTAKKLRANSCEDASDNSSSFDQAANFSSFPSTSEAVRCAFYIPDDNINKNAIMGAIEFIRSVLGFVFPFILICFCYSKIVMTVRRKVISKRVRKDRVAKLAAFVVGAFIVCWTPYHVMNLYSALGGWWGLFPVDPCFFVAVKPFTVCLGYANSCINPIVYAFTTTNFQENVRDMCTSDKSARPYRMVLSTKNEDKTPKAQDIPMQVYAQKKQTTKAHHQEEFFPRRCQNKPAQTDQSKREERQSFSYYSCPARAENLAPMESRISPESGVIHSAPENGECAECLMKHNA